MLSCIDVNWVGRGGNEGCGWRQLIINTDLTPEAAQEINCFVYIRR